LQAHAKCEFIRKSDDKVPVKGETDSVFADAKTGTPRAIPLEVSRVFMNGHAKQS
jgi:acyl-CoA thioesterase FadM